MEEMGTQMDDMEHELARIEAMMRGRTRKNRGNDDY